MIKCLCMGVCVCTWFSKFNADLDKLFTIKKYILVHLSSQVLITSVLCYILCVIFTHKLSWTH